MRLLYKRDNILLRKRFMFKNYLKLPNTNSQVRLIKAIRDIPAKGSKLPSFLNMCVEEAKTKEQFFKYLNAPMRYICETRIFPCKSRKHCKKSYETCDKKKSNEITN